METLIQGITGSMQTSIFYSAVLTISVTAFTDRFSFLPKLLFRLEIEGSGKSWRQDQKVRLFHVDTQGYLHSHDKKFSRTAGGQQEVRT